MRADGRDCRDDGDKQRSQRDRHGKDRKEWLMKLHSSFRFE